VCVCGGREGREIEAKGRGKRGRIQLLQHLNQHSLLDSSKYSKKREERERERGERVCVWREGRKRDRSEWEREER
jgi:hypothetical protein